MAATFYVGVTTRTRYSWVNQYIPAVLLDVNGVPVTKGTWNGETVVQSYRDGSVARGTSGGPVPGDPYSPGHIPSVWESA